MHHTPYRRRAAFVATALVAGLLPGVLVASPAGASPGCLADVSRSILSLDGCDDDTPPTTKLTSSDPQPNGAGYVRSGSISFAFSGSHTDADTGTIGFECRLGEAAWEACTSPKTYTGLADNHTGYVFQVRAVDSTDAAVTWSDTVNILDVKTEPDTTDADLTPESRTFKVDTTAPNTFIFETPYDEERPELPMVTSRKLTLNLDSTESAVRAVRYACTLDKAAVPCTQGDTTLDKLAPGDHTFTAAAIDPAGNRDAVPATTRFAVPQNLVAKPGSGWRRVKGGSPYFGGDYLEARTVGASLVTKSLTMSELRLIAPAGPNLGVIDIRIGNGKRRTVNLKAPNYQRFKVYVIRDQFSPKVTGRITIRVRALPGYKVARVDAILAH